MHPSYAKVFLTFARNSLIRDMSFRMNFILQVISSMSWAGMNWGLFKIIYGFTGEIGRGTGWHEDEFFIFLGTIWIINSIIQTLFMANAEEFSELIRTGNLDFALLKPIDTQFLISFPRMNWAQLPNGILGAVLIIYSMRNLMADAEKIPALQVSVFTILAFLFFVGCDDLPSVDQHLVWAKSKPLQFLVLHYELLSLPDGDLSTKRDWDGAVGDVYLYRADLGGLKYPSASLGPATWDALEDLGVGSGRIRCTGRCLVLSRQPVGV